jgi:hypothetical protein
MREWKLTTLIFGSSSFIVFYISFFLENRPDAVVKSSHQCQEVLGLSGLSAIIAGVRLARENPPPYPT